MNHRSGLTSVCIMCVLATLAACNGGGDDDGGGGGSVSAPVTNNRGGAGSGDTPKAWGTAELIGPDNAIAAADPQIAIDASGNAMAVWRQSGNIWSNRYTAGTGWGTATLIEMNDAARSPPTASLFSPQIAIDASGNAMAVWAQFDGTRDSIWANRYTAGSGWGTAVLIETDNAGDALQPDIAIDGSGNALAVWHQHDGMRTNILSNRYTAGSGWGTAAVIETNNAHPSGVAQIASDASGNALAVWVQIDGGRESIWANRYTVGSGWGTAALVETDSAGPASSPQIAFDANGNAVAVWYQYDGTRTNIWSNRYTTGISWGTAARIETHDAGNANDPQLAIHASGNALAVWQQWDGTRQGIFANRYTPGSGWGTAELIENDDACHASAVQIAIDANGNGLAVWSQSTPLSTDPPPPGATPCMAGTWFNHYNAATGWATAARMELGGHPQIAFDTNGNALAVGEHSGSIRANRYQ